MIPAYIIPVLTNHLWQSTAFAALIGLLVLVLRGNQARMRYWLWVTASTKFLISDFVFSSGGCGRVSTAGGGVWFRTCSANPGSD
ncbi:MAG: hypothetical protein M3Y27_19575, partial [Acidobacteriota bacterium]|nr:hypothetical protein [Acidobacteriota bacterium]